MDFTSVRMNIVLAMRTGEKVVSRAQLAKLAKVLRWVVMPPREKTAHVQEIETGILVELLALEAVELLQIHARAMSAWQMRALPRKKHPQKQQAAKTGSVFFSTPIQTSTAR